MTVCKAASDMSVDTVLRGPEQSSEGHAQKSSFLRDRKRHNLFDDLQPLRVRPWHKLCLQLWALPLLLGP